jgi:REP element-mobilizing transposase RayT
MATPRSQQIDLERTPYYHCISRVVRRAFLCGTDYVTGKNFDHRKAWLVDRFKYLANIFSIKICSYAVMDNHYHLVLFVDEPAALNWSEEELVRRWSLLFPNDAAKLGLAPDRQDKLKKWEDRLKDISWFMRCLNEPLARIANKEDECTGRFWEGRFKTQALLDEAALLTAMAYTDLNPIRSQLAQTPEESDFTSIKERIEVLQKGSKKQIQQPTDLMPFAAHIKNQKNSIPVIEFHLSDYLELVDATGRIIREDKKGFIPEHIQPILNRLNLTSEGWLMMVNHLESDFAHAVGHEEQLNTFKPDRIRKFKGSAKAKLYYAA